MYLKDTSIAAVVLLVALFFTGGPAPLAAQSLADVARQEQERRKAVKATSKVITNKDLVAVPAITPAAADDAATAAEAGKDGAKTEPGKTDASKTDAAKPGAEPAKDQAYWSSRAKALQSELSRNETFLVALQSRVNALANEYTNQSDPIQQARLATERQKAIDELNNLTRQIAEGKKAIATLQEDARRAGVPPSWVR
jgi:hypothetical protein